MQERAGEAVAGKRPLPHEVPSSGKWSLFRLKPLTICFATLLSLLGSAGQFFFIENFDDVINARAAEMRDIEQVVSTLRETHGLYFTAYTQSNLLFALLPTQNTPQANSNPQMFRLTLLDRGFPFRAILAELAISGAFKFADINLKYEALRNAAMTDFSYANYMALSNFEKDILEQAGDLQDKLQLRYLDAQAEKAAAETARDERRMWLVILTALGTLLLLAANLMAERRNAPQAAAGD